MLNFVWKLFMPATAKAATTQTIAHSNGNYNSSINNNAARFCFGFEEVVVA